MRRRQQLRGPAGCLRSPGLRGTCDVCAEKATHMPIQRPGRFCGRHCICCVPAAKRAPGRERQAGLPFRAGL